MDLINEDDVTKKIITPALDRLEKQTIPALAVQLQDALREVLDGATVTVTINLKKQT